MTPQSRKIKLLIGVNDFAQAGAQQMIVDELNNFDRSKYELALLTFYWIDDKYTLFDLVPPDVKIYRLNFNNFRDIKNWFRVYQILRKYKPDVIFSYLFFSNTILRVLKPLFRYKIMILEENTYFNKTKLKVLTDKILSYLTYKIIAISQTVKNFTADQEKISPDKFVVIHHSINYENIQSGLRNYNKNELKQKLGFEKEDKLVINAARVNWQKNHKLLIDSFAEFSKKNTGYKLIILGEGPLRDSLTSYVKSLGLEEKIILPGYKRNVYDYLFISEFFVLTSKMEGFSLAGIQAMAVGLPVVSTNVAGPDEYVVDGVSGYLIKNEDPKEIAAAMQKIVDRGQDYFSENCRKEAQKYDIKEHMKKIEAVIPR